MTDEQYFDWFLERKELFAELGIMHPKSDWGKIVRIVVEVSLKEIDDLKDKVEKLESEIKSKSKKANSAPKKTVNKTNGKARSNRKADK